MNYEIINTNTESNKNGANTEGDRDKGIQEYSNERIDEHPPSGAGRRRLDLAFRYLQQHGPREFAGPTDVGLGESTRSSTFYCCFLLGNI